MKLKAVISIIFIISAFQANASVTSILKFIANKDFNKANELIKKENSKDSSNYAYYYLSALSNFQNKSNQQNIFIALEQISYCATKYNINNDAKLLIKCDKIGINSVSINLLYHQIELEISYLAKINHTVNAYEIALKSNLLDTILRNELIKRRDDLAFYEANTKNDFLSFKEFLEKYPESNQAGLAKENYENLLYKTATDKNTTESYKYYIENYPNAKFIDKAKENYELLLYTGYTDNNDTFKIHEYISKFPNAKYRIDAEKKLFSLVCKHLSDDELLKIINYYSNCIISWEKAWDYFYLYQTSDNLPDNYIAFIKKYPNYYNYSKFKEDSTLSYLNIKTYEQNNLYGFVKDDSIVILESKFIEASDFNSKYALISKDCKNDKCNYSYIDKAMRILPFSYDEAYDFNDGVAIVGNGDCPEKNCRYGLINELGDTICAIKYTLINDLNDGLFLVVSDENKSGYMNNRGVLVIAPIYEKARNFKDSFAYVSLDTLNYFINLKGETQTQLPKFKIATDFINGVSSYTTDGVLWGLMNKEGRVIYNPIFKDIIQFEDGIAIAKKEDSNTKKGKTNYVLNTYELKLDGTFSIKK